VEYRILGPLEVVDEGEPVALGRLKERLVLATLLLHANEFVARERLIDELWGESPPPTARKAVNVYVSQLRKALVRNGHDPITTADGGYRLEVDAEQLDAARLQQLLATARERASAGEPEAAAELLREALALWRGPTLAGLLLESRGREEIAQLDELRLTALMDRIDCDLALGRHGQVLGELHVLVGEHPLRERLRAQQMVALYRADRQADALDAYQQARQTLTEELGIEPSESLQRLQQAILQHDPALEAPAGTTAVNGRVRMPSPSPPSVTAPDGGAPRRRFRPARWQLALARSWQQPAPPRRFSPRRRARPRISFRTASSGSIRAAARSSRSSGSESTRGRSRSPRRRSGPRIRWMKPSPATTCAPTACSHTASASRASPTTSSATPPATSGSPAGPRA
jgi:DNA-binding SARP family transcriptional activator